MPTWAEGIAAIANAPETQALERQPLPRRRMHAPVIVTGYAGSGKTAIWRHLTGRDAPNRLSHDVDQDWLPLRQANRRTSITTIPGQTSAGRTVRLERYFGRGTIVGGVVFVATFGFDHVWPQQADVVAAELSTVDMSHLSDWNIKRELESFQETCREIRRKYQSAPDPAYRPKWLLVLVNKVDLYWDALDHAAEYYLPDSESPFNEHAMRLQQGIGQLAGFQYSVLPMTTDPAPYIFQSNFGGFTIESQLDDRHARASLSTLGSALEGLSGL
jgi:GTPase SAR1 family protein